MNLLGLQLLRTKDPTPVGPLGLAVTKKSTSMVQSGTASEWVKKKKIEQLVMDFVRLFISPYSVGTRCLSFRLGIH